MSGDGDLENLVLSLIERFMGGRYSERHGLVTSYDPDKHLAKVTFQPEGQESGWVPIETGHIGNGYGIVTGLQPGDGKSTGDQVVVRYQENDFESGKIVQRVHSDDQKPPKVQSGETMVYTRFRQSQGGPESAQGAQGGTGQQIYLKNDGTINVTDGNGATLIMDGNGNVAITCKNYVVNASGFAVMVAAGAAGIKGTNVEIKASGLAGIDGDGSVVIQGNGNVTTSGVTPPTPQPNVLPPTTVPK